MTLSPRNGILTLVLALLLAVTGVSAQEATEAACEDGFKPIEHALGVACVKESPERIVALEWTYAEDLLALGIQPVGVADIAGYNGWVSIPVTLDETVADVGTRNAPNLETIVSLNPDLILAVSFRVVDNYDELSAIAPTLVFNPYPEDFSISQFDEMETTFMAIAEAVDRVQDGEQVLSDMHNYFATAQAALADAGHAGEGFILSQGWAVENVATFRLFTDNALAVEILTNLGMENVWDADPTLYGFTEIGIEGFADLLDKSFGFFYVAPADANEAFAASPLWASLPFIRDERAYWLGPDVWLFGGPLSAELLVDTVLAAMDVELPEPETELAPDITPTPEL